MSEKLKQQLNSMISTSIDINYVGNPNEQAEGIVNVAFEELDKSKADSDEAVLSRKDSLDVAEVECENIQPNSLRELVNSDVQLDDGETNSMEVDSELNTKEDSRRESTKSDPFDTSAFDSQAFDAFESRFKATTIHITTSGDDPFASPFKTAKKSDNEKNEFDSFEPFVPKQPENTPFKAQKPKKKKDSFEDSDSDFDDDDDEEDNLKIVIKAKMKEPSDSGTGLCKFYKYCLSSSSHF